MEASYEGDQGSEAAVVPYMDAWMILRLIVFVVGNYMCHVTDRAGSGEKLYKVVPTSNSKYFSLIFLKLLVALN